MKKIYTYIVIILFIGSSCNEKLDLKPISSATTVTFYATTNDFIQSINGVYNSLQSGIKSSSPFADAGYPDRQLGLSEIRSDNLYAVADGPRVYEPINNFHKTISSNAYVEEAWNSNFNGIFRANILLDQLEKNGDVIAPDNLKTRIEAEAKFLRAFFYFDLVKWFGKLPIITYPVSVDEAVNIPRSPVGDVYQLIIDDLKFAADNLPQPESYAVGDKGRATKYAAKGMLALVYMTRSGPTYDIEGPGLGLNEWNLAMPLLDEIIANPNYAFGTSYNDIFSWSNENNSEVIFDVQYAAGYDPVVGATYPSLLAPVDFLRSAGKTKVYRIKRVSNDLLARYETGDTRKDFCIHQTGFVFNNVQEIGSFVKKYVDITNIPNNNADWPINFIVLRYTDILLLKAECILHGAPGSQANDVDAVINQVRQRAGLSGTKTNITLSELLDERRKEFLGEGSRWHDLVRFGMVESVMTSWIASEDVLNQIRPFQKDYILYPLPQAELDVKVGLYEQNKGY